MNQLPTERRRASRDAIKRADPAVQESQFVKLIDPSGQRALWIRLGVLQSANGFRRSSEAWAVLFERGAGDEMKKTALKQVFDFGDTARSGDSFRVGDCEITPEGSRGSIQAKGRKLSWDLSAQPAQDLSFNWVPEALTRSGLSRARNLTLGADLRFSGSCTLDGESVKFQAAPGIRETLQSAAYAHSWVWGQCNAFVNERGDAVDCVFEGRSVRSRLLGALPSPKLSTFLFRYQDKTYALNTFWDALRARSHHNFTEWAFQADHEEFSFRGRITAGHRDFAGVTYEDTDGSFLYGANAQLCDMTLSVYRRGKLETTLRGAGTAALELCSRDQNPYVPLLI